MTEERQDTNDLPDTGDHEQKRKDLVEKAGEKNLTADERDEVMSELSATASSENIDAARDAEIEAQRVEIPNEAEQERDPLEFVGVWDVGARQFVAAFDDSADAESPREAAEIHLGRLTNPNDGRELRIVEVREVEGDFEMRDNALERPRATEGGTYEGISPADEWKDGYEEAVG